MRHEDILYLASDHRSGRLTPAQTREVERHLARCASCRHLYAAWRLEEPTPGFADRVMSDLDRLVVLEPRPSAPSALWNRLPWWGAAAAMLLIALVFYRPEREWTDADRSFAWLGSQTHEASPGWPTWKGARHD